MDRKVLILAIVGVVVLVLVSVIGVIALSGGEKKKTVEVPPLSSFPDQSVDLSVSQADIREGPPVYFPLGAQGSNVTLIYSINVVITWSDDEQAPIYRFTYQNQPDLFTVTLRSIKAGGGSDPNATMNASGSANTGSLSVTLSPTSTPGFAMGSGSGNWSVPTTPSADPGSNSTLYIEVSVVAGDLESSRPALLKYNDFGDVIDMAIKITYKTVPIEVYDHYFGPNAAGTSI